MLEDGTSSPVMVVIVVGDEGVDAGGGGDGRCCLTKSPTMGLVMILQNRGTTTSGE